MKKSKLHALNRLIVLIGACLLWQFSYGQDQPGISVSGTVTDGASKEPLIGVVVVPEGGTGGTQTDIDGKYTITVDPNATLIFTYAGYAEQKIAVGGQTTIDVTMGEDVQTLKEIVAIGYGTQEKKDVTGAISSIKARDIQQQPVASLDQVLQGRAAGVQVQTNSGAPGGTVSIRIRGTGTTNSTEPLYVIDGMPITNQTGNGSQNGFATNTSAAFQTSNPLSLLNPQDIESIDVLKDASATAIYGSRAANGVVLITTKRGKSGKPSLIFDTYHGLQKVVSTIPVLNASQFAEYTNRMTALYPDASKANPAWANPSSLGEGTNWQNEIFRTAPISNYQLSLSGGNEVSQFAVSAGYFKQLGVVTGTKFDRYSFRVNTDHQVTKRFKLGNTFSLSRTDEMVVNTEDPYNGVIGNALRFQPTMPVKVGSGWYGPDTSSSGGFLTSSVANPVATAEYLIQNNVVRNRALGTLYGEYQFFEGFKFRTNWGIDLIMGQQHIWEPSATFGRFSRPNARQTEFRANSVDWLTENTFSYDKTLGKHTINAVVGMTAQENNYENVSVVRQNFLTNDVHNISSGGSQPSAEGSNASWSLASFLGRVAYSFNSKYMVTGTIRRDASSRFPEANQWATFPSVSLGWRISEESFLKDNLVVISNLKLRAGWGQSGNQEIGNYPYQANLGTFNYTLGTNKAIAQGVAPNNLANSKIKWETVTQSNVGIDLGLVRNRIIFTADYFVKNTTDMLIRQPLPTTSGLGEPDLTGNFLFAPYANLGEIKNNGIELSLSTRNLVGEFTWSTDIQFSTAKNKVIKLTGKETDVIISQLNYQNSNRALTRTQVGQPISSYYGFVTEGIFQTSEEVAAHAKQEGAAPGDFRFKDVNGDGTINDDDRTWLGNPNPKFQFGFNNTFAYKGFDLNIFFQGVVGNKLFNTQKFITHKFNASSSGLYDNVSTDALEAWNGPGTSNEIPRYTNNDPNGNLSKISDRFIEDGSYLRLKNLQIGYRLPGDLVKKIGIQTVRIYATGANLFTVTKYTGFDPEVGSYQQNALMSGVDLGRYPLSRVYTLGLTVGF